MQNETKKELHTQMWKIENPKDFTPHDREVLEKAAAIIRAGGLVAFPTETVYGLAPMRPTRRRQSGFMRRRDARLTTR